MSVPGVFGFDTSLKSHIGGSFILMECLSRNAVVDLPYKVPMSKEHRISYSSEIARNQVSFPCCSLYHQKFALTMNQAELSSITFPKIGSLTRREDGTRDIGALSGLGGPFDTVSEYLEASADATIFHGLESLKEIYGEECGNRLEASILAFPRRLKKLAVIIPNRNHGPFALIHPDFAFWNVIVDDDYKVLGVTDEFAHSGPWEMVHFPACFMSTPAPIGSARMVR